MRTFLPALLGITVAFGTSVAILHPGQAQEGPWWKVPGIRCSTPNRSRARYVEARKGPRLRSFEAPSIGKIEPDEAKPGDKVTIKGENFGSKECFHG